MFEDLIDNMDVDDEVNNDVSKEEVIVDKLNDERCINTIVDNILNKYESLIEDDNLMNAAKMNENENNKVQVASRPNIASLKTCSVLITQPACQVSKYYSDSVKYDENEVKGDGICEEKNLVKMDDEANLVKELAFEFMNKKCPRVRKNVLSPIEQFDAETEFQFIAYCVQNSLFDQLCEFLDPKEDLEEEEEFPEFVFGEDPDGKEKEEDEESDDSECSDGWEKVKRKRKRKRKDSKDCKEKERRREKGKSGKGNVEERFEKENEERQGCFEKERKDGKENEGKKEGVMCSNTIKRISFDVNIRVVNGDGSVVTKSDNFSDKINIRKLMEEKEKLESQMDVVVAEADEKIKNLMFNLDVIRNENNSLKVMLVDMKQMVKDREAEINRLKNVNSGACGTVMRSRKWGPGNGSGLGQGANRGQSPRAPKGPILKNKDQLGKEVEIMKEMMPEVVTNNMKDAELMSLEESSRAGDVRSSLTMMLKKNLNIERRIAEDQEMLKKNKEVAERTEKYLGSGGR